MGIFDKVNYLIGKREIVCEKCGKVCFKRVNQRGNYCTDCRKTMADEGESVKTRK